MQPKDYQKYRWFFTSSEKLVIGGKSAEQNDSMLSELKGEKENYFVMHTSNPGSPFSVIISPRVSSSDLEEAAIFTACFSQQWKAGKKKARVDIFKLSQLHKSPKMKAGTWGISGNIEKSSAFLELVLTKQKSKLRAVPEKTVDKFLLKIFPGRIDKTKMADKISKILDGRFNKEEILSALPPGGVSISK